MFVVVDIKNALANNNWFDGENEKGRVRANFKFYAPTIFILGLFDRTIKLVTIVTS